MTKREAIELCGIAAESYDTALPKPWVDRTASQCSLTTWDVCGQFVWLYDAAGGSMGRPYALTLQGNRILRQLNQENGSQWLLNPNPAD